MKKLIFILLCIMLSACAEQEAEIPAVEVPVIEIPISSIECSIDLVERKTQLDYKCKPGYVVVQNYSNGVECARPVVKCELTE